MSGQRVAGFCPMGCGETLRLDYLTRVYCESAACPRQMAAHEILDTDMTDHIGVFTETDFALQHPLRERLDHELLLHCPLNVYLKGLDGPPCDDVIGEQIIGTYQVVREDSAWVYYPVESVGGGSRG